MKIEDIAKVSHEVNAAFCLAFGDYSQAPWEYAAKWQKESSINGVKFHIDNPKALPSHSHDSWLKEKEKNGWTYGEIKNYDKKTHPCMVPFEDLTDQQKAKDYIFRQIVHSLINIS